MTEKTPEPPRGLSRILYRLPIWLYRLHLGWLLGQRFLLLNHVGRKSGKPRQVVLEVVDHDETTGTYTVASGFGPKSDWYQNIRQQPHATIHVGRRGPFPVKATFLTPEESGQAMADYARRHPRAAQNLSRLIGYDVDGTEENYRSLGREAIPFVVFVSRK